MIRCHFFANGGYLTLEGDSSYIHSFSFKCEGLTNIWIFLLKCENKIVVLVTQQEMETRLYFLTVCGLCRRESRYSTCRRLCDQSCFAVVGGLMGKQTVWVLMHEQTHLSFERLVRWRWWPVLARYLLGLLARRGTSEDLQSVLWEQLCFVKRKRPRVETDVG